MGRHRAGWGHRRDARVHVAGVLAFALVATACGGGGDVDTDESFARLAVVNDVVDVRADTTVFAPGELGQGLDVGNDVRTGNPGFAQVDFLDGSLARIDIDSIFAVTELAEVEGAVAVDLDLEVGRAWNRVRDVSESGGRYDVGTPVGVAAVRGTAFDVDCRDAVNSGCTFTAVEGGVTVSNAAGASVDLVAVQRVTVAADGTIGEVVDLTLADIAADAWMARNLGADTAAGFPALIGPVAPPVVAEGEQPPPPGAYTDGARVREAELEAIDDATVVQRVVVGGPAQVRLGWNFCNAQVCGTSENVECVGNRYIPKYAGDYLSQTTIGALPGYELSEAVLNVGPTRLDAGGVVYVDATGASGALGAFREPPAIVDGGLTFTVAASGLEDTLRRLPEFPDRACGITLEERDAILAEYGPVAEVDSAVVEAVLTWVAADGSTEALEGQAQTIALDGRETAITLPALAAPTPAGTTDAPVFLRTDPAWATRTVGVSDRVFGETGDVATALANALVRLGLDTDPGEVGDTLAGLTAWRPGQGTTLTPLAINGPTPVDIAPRFVAPEVVAATPPEPVLASEVTAVEMLASLQRGDPALHVVGLSRRAGLGTAVTVVGYDLASDEVTVLHPSQGEVVVPFTALLQRLQIVVRIASPGTPSQARVL